MMPVVDASVGLSQSDFSISDYLSGIKQFHVLRMIAVQRQHSGVNTLQELHYFQSQSATPGFSGFPNAIVANVNLFNPTAIMALVKVGELENLRGVCHCFAENGDDANRSDWERSLTILAQNNLNLDLLSVQASEVLVAQMAAFQPELNIIVSISGATTNQEQSSVQKLIPLAKFNNVYFKICGAEPSSASNLAATTTLIDDAIELFGFERIMFASGVNQHWSIDSFDRLWSQYVEACSSLSANCRDNLFRSNAIRVYDL